MDFVLKICRRVHRSATACGCLGDGKRTVRPAMAGVLPADGTGDPRRPGTDRRHPGTGLHRSVRAGRRRVTTSTGSSPSAPRPCAPAGTSPKPAQIRPGRVGCPTGQPTCPCGAISRAVRLHPRRQNLLELVPQRPPRSPPANAAADPVAGLRPSPVRERNKITSKTAHQAVPELRNPRRDQPGGTSPEGVPQLPLAVTRISPDKPPTKPSTPSGSPSPGSGESRPAGPA